MAACAIALGCSCKPAGASRADAITAFPLEVEGEAMALLSGTMFSPAPKIVWTAAAKVGMQEGSNPLDVPSSRGDRVLREGTLDGAVPFWVEGYYSYERQRFTSVTIVADFPEPPAAKRSIGNVSVTPELLKELNVHPALIPELMKGLGKGSMSGSGPLDFQARAVVGTKTFEVSTAITRGTPLELEFSCNYFRP